MTTTPRPGVGCTRLVVAYSFPPFQDTSGIVAAKRVRARDEPVDLLQNRLTALRGEDIGLEAIASGLIQQRAVLTAPAKFGVWPSIGVFVAQGEQQVETWESAGRRYRTMYSRAHFSASHILAGLLKVDRPDLFWEAEFSDVLSRKVGGERRAAEVQEDDLLERVRAAVATHGIDPPRGTRLFEWAEILTYVFADSLLFTNADQVEISCAWAPIPEVIPLIRAKARVEHHPPPPRQLFGHSTVRLDADPDRVAIGYFGNIAAGSGVQTVLTALAELPEPRRARLALYLYTPDPQALQDEAERLGIGDAVRAQPFVPYLDMLALLRQMDVLLVSDHARPAGQPRNPYLLAKWSDYKASDTPVWGLVDPGSTLSEQPLEHRSPLGHVTATMQVLATLAARGPAGLRS